MEHRKDQQEDSRREESRARSTGNVMDSYLRDPWACYEDDDSFCGTEEVAEDECCCCC